VINELQLGQRPGEPAPSRNRRAVVGAYSAALLVHVLAIASLIRAPQSDATRLETGVHRQEGIEAFVFPASRPTGTTGVARVEPTRRPPVRPPRSIDTTQTPPPATTSGQASAAATGSTETEAAAPVRLGSGRNLGLLKKVDPVYPPVMEAAGLEGVVVLDAVIHRDGTIGDITVLRSTAPAFEQAAIDAVKQWRYTPLPYEGIVTVTMNFGRR
jgi:protein TonB